MPRILCTCSPPPPPSARRKRVLGGLGSPAIIPLPLRLPPASCGSPAGRLPRMHERAHMAHLGASAVVHARESDFHFVRPAHAQRDQGPSPNTDRLQLPVSLCVEPLLTTPPSNYHKQSTGMRSFTSHLSHSLPMQARAHARGTRGLCLPVKGPGTTRTFISSIRLRPSLATARSILARAERCSVITCCRRLQSTRHGATPLSPPTHKHTLDNHVCVGM